VPKPDFVKYKFVYSQGFLEYVDIYREVLRPRTYATILVLGMGAMSMKLEN